jgi:TPR repeat protein
VKEMANTEEKVALARMARRQKNIAGSDVVGDSHLVSPYDAAEAEMNRATPDHSVALGFLEDAYKGGDKRAAYALGTWYLFEKKALDLLAEAADARVPDALYDLALVYEEGELGVTPDPDRAFELYLRAALRGQEQSVYEVGRCYYYGLGIPEDRRIAALWRERASELGIE